MDLDSSPHVHFIPPGLEIPSDARIPKIEIEQTLLDTLASKTVALKEEPAVRQRGFDQLQDQVALLTAHSQNALGQIGIQSSRSWSPAAKLYQKRPTNTPPKALAPRIGTIQSRSMKVERGSSTRTFITEGEPSKFGMTTSPSMRVRQAMTPILSAREKAAVLYKDEMVSRSKAGRLESAYFPGVEALEGINVLPGGVDIASFINRITPPTSLTRDMKQRKDAWRAMIKSKEHKALTRDGFWWFYLQHFRARARGCVGMSDDDPDTTVEVKDSLFGRMASNFVNLLLGLDHHHRHRVSDQYADILGQSIYTAFSVTFPKSLVQFNDNFCAELVCTIQEWVSGFRPHNPAPAWQLEALSRPLRQNFRPVIVEEIQAETDEVSVAGDVAVVPPLNLRGLGAKISQKKHPSVIAGRIPRREQSVMDIFGTSPFVSYYLAQRGVPRANPKPFFLRRTDNNTEQTQRMKRTGVRPSGNSPGSLTYRDIRRASRWQQRQLSERYDKSLATLHRGAKTSRI